MSAIHRAWVQSQTPDYRALLETDRKQIAYLRRLFQVAGNKPFPGCEHRLDELRIARKRERAWIRRIEQLEDSR